MKHRRQFKDSTGRGRCQEQYFSVFWPLQWPQRPSETIFYQRVDSSPPRPLGLSKSSGPDRVKMWTLQDTFYVNVHLMAASNVRRAAERNGLAIHDRDLCCISRVLFRPERQKIALACLCLSWFLWDSFHSDNLHHWTSELLQTATGQYISKANSKLFIWTKKPTKIFLYFCPSFKISLKSSRNKR